MILHRYHQLTFLESHLRNSESFWGSLKYKNKTLLKFIIKKKNSLTMGQIKFSTDCVRVVF